MVWYCSEGTIPVLLRNVLNDTGNGRKFTIKRGLLPSVLNSTVLATFYDYAEDVSVVQIWLWSTLNVCSLQVSIVNVAFS